LGINFQEIVKSLSSWQSGLGWGSTFPTYARQRRNNISGHYAELIVMKSCQVCVVSDHVWENGGPFLGLLKKETEDS